MYQNYNMINVGEKNITKRRAVAQGQIVMAQSTIEKIKHNQMPKGNVLVLAEIAGISAVKKTPELLPLCHPLPIDAVYVQLSITDSNTITATCEVHTHAKTGVEMEALMGVQAALLCVYDLTKGVDPVLEISHIFLREKEGGKSGHFKHPKILTQHSQSQAGILEHPITLEKMHTLQHKKVVCLTLSDRCSQNKTQDESGKILCDYVKNQGALLLAYEILPDDKDLIQNKVRYFCHELKADLLLTTGGTGISPRDVTIDAITPLFTKAMTGLGEKLRQEGAKQTEMSWLSRSEAGVINHTLVIALPGSPRAVQSGLLTLCNLIPHALDIMQGHHHDVKKQ